MQIVEKTGRNKDMAIEEALRELNASRDMVVIEILEDEKEGILGIFGARPAKVRVTLKDDKRKLAGELLENILKYMNIPCNVKLETPGENQATLSIDGENVGNVIGKRGSTLNALEYLLNVMVNKEGSDKIAVSIDASGYRESRVKSLEELSLKLAAKVKDTNKSVELEPMTSQERKVIHTTLKNNTDVYTYSKGEEPYRKVVISAKNKSRGGQGKPSEDGARSEKSGHSNNSGGGNRKRRPSHHDGHGKDNNAGGANGGRKQYAPPTRTAINTAVENLMKATENSASAQLKTPSAPTEN
ncbi:MAG TPA: RNA-binding cell elongation regulator Jag/EloR [Candidatus Wallbacteria bacterium]|nr:MAG: R3H domain protein [bacterium ADurb.Bin243]HOD42882.1 RNA-binding cell elongation regulator Jag/EloR [Candidatus Wallbacteria bacterium]HPG56834.1 RNA-binding cell elongation regulator Jag/EloR [Candidatus Wallbacteria bacterium]